MALPLANRTAVVTGGTNGIGRATALRLAREGARVFVGDVNLLAENESLFAELGITALRCDVRIDADVRKLIETAHGATGRLEILVNNAGIGLVKQIPDVTDDEWDRVLDILNAELTMTMRQCGTPTLARITKEHVARI